MKIKLLSFTGESFSHKDVTSLTVMTQSGEVTILNRHSPMITAVEPCVLYTKYLDNNGMEMRDDFAVGRGVLEVHADGVVIMADMLVDIEEVDLNKAKEAKERALELMEKYKNSKDKVDMEKFIEAEDALLKSIAQLKLYDLKK